MSDIELVTNGNGDTPEPNRVLTRQQLSEVQRMLYLLRAFNAIKTSSINLFEPNGESIYAHLAQLNGEWGLNLGPSDETLVGPPGPQGPQGIQGPPGDLTELTGGEENEVLTKKSAADFDFGWQSPSGLKWNVVTPAPGYTAQPGDFIYSRPGPGNSVNLPNDVPDGSVIGCHVWPGQGISFTDSRGIGTIYAPPGGGFRIGQGIFMEGWYWDFYHWEASGVSFGPP